MAAHSVLTYLVTVLVWLLTPKAVHEVNLEERVPQDHLLRRIAAVIDFSFVQLLTARFYSHTSQRGSTQ